MYEAMLFIMLVTGEITNQADKRGPYATEAQCLDRVKEGTLLFESHPLVAKVSGVCIEAGYDPADAI